MVDKSAAELKGRLHALDIYTRNSPSDVAESIKELRRALGPDTTATGACASALPALSG